MKKKLGLLAVAALSVLVIAGCGKSKDDTTKTSAKGNYDKEITIDVYDDLANYQGIQKGWFAKIVKDKFNMKSYSFHSNKRSLQQLWSASH